MMKTIDFTMPRKMVQLSPVSWFFILKIQLSILLRNLYRMEAETAIKRHYFNAMKDAVMEKNCQMELGGTWKVKKAFIGLNRDGVRKMFSMTTILFQSVV